MNLKGILPYVINGVILLFILFTVTPVKLNYSSMAIILLVVLALGIRIGVKGWKAGTSILIFLISTPLLIYLLGLLNTSNLPEGMSFVIRNTSFLAFPLIFYFLGKWVNRKAILQGYLIALSLTNIYLIYLFVYYFNFGARFYRVVSVDIFHSTYLGLYNLVAFWICIHFYRLRRNKASIGLAAFFGSCALLPSSRIIFILAFLSLLASLFVLIRSRKKMLGWGLIIILVSSGILIGTPSIRQKFKQITELEQFGFDRSNYKSVSSRFGKIEGTSRVIRDHFFWGTGTGDLNDVLVEAYREMKFTMGYKYRDTPHNQVLDNLARNGFLGGGVALAALYLLPLWIGIRRKNLLLVSFSLLIAGVSLTESIMDVHKGITFYAFFACFLCYDALYGIQAGEISSGGREDGDSPLHLLYLLGAGRSGTTLISTVLNACPGVRTLGEMHQFFDYLDSGKPCSCGSPLRECEFWGPVLETLPFSEEQVRAYAAMCDQREWHSRIPGLLLKDRPDTEYLEIQEKVFRAASHISDDRPVLLDSSKYIARFLLLNGSRNLKVTGVYIVRDGRGVIESFRKKVQTPKTPLSSILYYSLINFFGELTYRFYGNVVKVKYETFLEDPEGVVRMILEKAEAPVQIPRALPSHFEVPHIVGGNRMKSKREIRIDPHISWRQKIPRAQQLFYYFATLPTMLVNRYKP